MKPEEKARQRIDQLLSEAGWVVQDVQELNLGAAPGVAVREFPLESGYADYLLFVEREAVGVVEAKSEGTTLSGVADQSDKYATGLPENLPHVQEPLPFAYESTGIETFFRDLRDPDTLSRRVFAFHKPETLYGWASQGDTLRDRLREMPSLITEGLRDCQIQAIENLEQSFAALIAFNIEHNLLDSVMNTLSDHSKVVWACTTTGRFDGFAFVRFSSNEELSFFLRKELGETQGIKDMETFICLHIEKYKPHY